MNYKNYKKIPTKKLKEIIDHKYHQGIDGADYGPVIHILKEIYFLRMQKKEMNENENKLKELERIGA